MNIGVKPTFETGELKPSFEAHLFEFSEQIYGETVMVELIAFLRPERKFTSLDELVDQIKLDADEAKQQLTTRIVIIHLLLLVNCDILNNVVKWTCSFGMNLSLD